MSINWTQILSQLSSRKAAASQTIEMQYQSVILKLLQQKMMMHQKLQSDLTKSILRSTTRFEMAHQDYAIRATDLEIRHNIAVSNVMQRRQRVKDAVERMFSTLLVQTLIIDSNQQRQSQQIQHSHNGHSANPNPMSISNQHPINDHQSRMHYIKKKTSVTASESIPFVLSMANSSMRSLMKDHRDHSSKVTTFGSTVSSKMTKSAVKSDSVISDFTEKYKMDSTASILETQCSEHSEFSTSDRNRYFLHRFNQKLKPFQSLHQTKDVHSFREINHCDDTLTTSRSTMSTQSASSSSSSQSCNDIDIVDSMKPLQCLVCSESFDSTKAFTFHLQSQSHSQQKSLWRDEQRHKQSLDDSSDFAVSRHSRDSRHCKPFACNLCHRTFQQLNALNIHIRIHTGEKPYHCQYCERSFRQRCHLIRHNRLHTGERPYQCHVCCQCFSSSTRKKRHLKREHGIEGNGNGL